MGRLIVAAAAVLLSAAAFAQSSDERAKAAFDAGAMAYEEGRYEDAIPLWEEAWRLSLQPLILYNLANAYERAGELELALENLERYAPSAPPEEQIALAKRIAALEVRVAAIHAERDRAAAEQARREAELLAERQRLEQEAMTRQTADERQPRSPAGWIVGGIGVAALATGIGFTAAAGGSRGELASLCVEGDDGALCPVGAADVVARNRGQRIAGWAGLGTGVVALGVGGVLIALPVDGHAGVTFRRRW